MHDAFSKTSMYEQRGQTVDKMDSEAMIRSLCAGIAHISICISTSMLDMKTSSNSS